VFRSHLRGLPVTVILGSSAARPRLIKGGAGAETGIRDDRRRGPRRSARPTGRQARD
jgi:hypothetical protein